MSNTIPIVIKLQTDAKDTDIPVATLLRTAKVIATKLDLPDALIWIDHELNGYDDVAALDLPSYRQMTGEPKCLNPYQGWQPLHCESSSTYATLSKAGTGQPIGTIENMMQGNESGHFVQSYSPEMKSHIMNELSSGHTDVHLKIPSGAVFGVVETVRNLVLNWSLEMEKAGILGDGMTFTEAEKSDAPSVVQQFFATNIGQVGNVNDQAQVAINQTTGIDLDGVRDLIAQMQGAMSLLPDPVQQELAAVVENVTAELETEQPNESRLRDLMNSASTICEGAAGNIAAHGIIDLIAKAIS